VITNSHLPSASLNPFLEIDITYTKKGIKILLSNLLSIKQQRYVVVCRIIILDV